jgi:hypothetical protein
MCWVSQRFAPGYVGRRKTQAVEAARDDRHRDAKNAARSTAWHDVAGTHSYWHTLCKYLPQLSIEHRSRTAPAPSGEPIMASIAIHDLSHNLALDRKAMTAIRGGGGAPWVFGWIQPYVRSSPSMGPVVNLYEVQNNFYADQMINQFQTVDVRNSAPNSNISVAPDALSRNTA